MPSRDATGKRLSGAQQRRKAQAGLTEDEEQVNPFAGSPPPPCASGPAAVEAWAAELGAAALQAAESGEDPGRVRWISRTVRRLGQLGDKARKSAKAVAALREYRGVAVDLLADHRPGEPIAVAAWAYYRLAQALHEGATAPAWDEDVEARLAHVVEAAATLGYVWQGQAIRELTSQLKAEAAGRGDRRT